MTQAALLLPCLLTGGTEVASLETVIALQAMGYTAEVVVYYDELDAAMLRTFAAAGIHVHCLGLSRGGGNAAALRLAWRLQQHLRQGRYGLIWVQYMTPTLMPLLVARLFGRCLIAAVHVAAGHYSPGGLRRLRWLARWWCDRFVCVSRTSASGIFGDNLDAAGYRKRVRVIPNTLDMAAVDSAKPRDWRQEFGFPDQVLLIGYVGRLAHNKGVDILLRAAAQLKTNQTPLHWIIVGDGADRPKLEALATGLDLAGVVHFVGRVPRESIYAAIKGFDLVVVPSREEGFGLSAVEAMACGVPVVASRVDALQEVVVDGVTGLLSEPEDPEDMASKLKNLMMDTGLEQRFREAGIIHVSKRFGRTVYQARIHDMARDR